MAFPHSVQSAVHRASVATLLPRPPRWRRPGPNLLLAMTGLTSSAVWPGTWLSPTSIAVLIMGLLPLGLNTLMRLEADLEASRAVPEPGD